MSKKDDLLKNYVENKSENFTTRELDALMRLCDCEKFSGGRGSGIGFVHNKTLKILQFDQPHPGNELYQYQIKKTIQFLKDIEEITNNNP